jgi:hypothetical protein
VDPSTLGDVAFEEIPRTQPNAGDIVAIAKHFMADPCAAKAIVLVTVDHAAAIRQGFRQPNSTAEKRTIEASVRKNIQTYAPRCVAQKCISQDAATHLLAWVEGTLPSKPRPTSYPCLDFRQPDPFPTLDPVPPAPWAPPARMRHVSFKEVGGSRHDDIDSDTDGDEAPISLAALGDR